MKLFQENIGEYLHGLRFSNGFLNMIPKIQTTEEKLDKLNFKFLCIK